MLIYILIISVAFTAITIITTRIVEDNLLNQRVTERLRRVNDFSVTAAPHLADKDAKRLYNLAIDMGRETGGRVLVFNGMGIVQIDSFSMLNGVEVSTRELLEVLTGVKDVSAGYHQIHGDKSLWAAYYSAAIIENSHTIGAVLLSESIEDIASKTSVIKNQYLLVFFISTLLIVIVSYFLTNHISRPLEQLRDGAFRIGNGDFDTRVVVKGRNEIVELANAFNYMSGKLENVDKQRSEFVSNASHELKTPLASIKLLIESLLYQDTMDEALCREFLGDVDGEIDRLTLLINDLLLISKMDDESPILREEDLVDITDRAVAQLRPIAQRKGVYLNFEYLDSVPLTCEKNRIRQAVNNIVDNSVKYTPEGGRVDVSVGVSEGYAFICVKDTGEGIPEEHLPHLFERFYRVDKARSRETGGTGLGLYIVSRVVRAHGGKIEIESTPGKGTTAELLFPCTDKTRNKRGKLD